MPILSHPAFGPKTALGYVTGGALLCVWTLVWYFTRGQDRSLDHTDWFWLAGLFLTGITFVFLGLILGPLGRVARQAELPPSAALSAEAAIQQTAAAHAPAVAPSVPAVPVTPQQVPVTPVAPAPVAPAH
ncbi:hypothetical protein GobsT_30580 [Gemmata obscuriglobus]|uniref:hypothetical protein n=1 Tax=Gemmata obscuriglobus TaxID=114 RepID=UPI0011CCE338|nr:hypothetical protein [Gemmata obscuriglobus]QEG28282.1 hypothetical protein GobsT_30580 [Gemmata obscuriglobus]VTS06099.1 unnamed protein product [Gemmata obscuriglobus UQM 2246]